MGSEHTERKLYRKRLRTRLVNEQRLRKALAAVVEERNGAYGIEEVQMNACGMQDDAKAAESLVELVSTAVDTLKLGQRIKLDLGSERQYMMTVHISAGGLEFDVPKRGP